ncbi:hypothetical protein [Shewanella aestuarii]|uniref:Uncharacterized protein n=1 Tax=Shewanella aestuarii TaxID=1028752 RepID=A0A6G9QMF6_9GAMM|nr:hypothetical protein [Shewanella aestuarii]QIR15011.1 hypothetical protein HBH39_11400 [Shewanella aestuarii]
MLSSLYLGFSAYHNGLGVKRWAAIGGILGPLAYPLFNTHKHLAYRKVQGLHSQIVKF